MGRSGKAGGRRAAIRVIGRGLGVLMRAVVGFLGKALRLLVTSAKTSPADDALNNSIRGGVMNHRTGRFDEGNDPAGWYEKD